MRIHPTIKNEVKQSEIQHVETIVQTMGNTHWYLRDYACLHAAMHYRTNQQDNVTSNPLITTILTH